MSFVHNKNISMLITATSGSESLNSVCISKSHRTIELKYVTFGSL